MISFVTMEVLSPAGSFLKLKYAVLYGADAVYAAGRKFGLRAKSANLMDAELEAAVKFCHSHNVKIYITVNIYAHNHQLKELPEYLQFLKSINVDAVIVSDPGVFRLAQEAGLNIHISTQANITSWKSAEFWWKLGASRVILARELSLEEISEIHRRLPDLELEIFVHGAMCMSYSGRCLISAYLNDRSANQGLCTHPCRWDFSLKESSRPGEEFPVQEDEYGTYIMNSKDLCLFDYLKEIRDAGICSVKIEGRMKSILYTSNVTRVYKTAVSNLNKNNDNMTDMLRTELDKLSHRQYSTGFFIRNDENLQNYTTSQYIQTYQFIGDVFKVDESFIYYNSKHKVLKNSTIQIISPDITCDRDIVLSEMYTENDEPLEFTKPNTIIKIPIAIAGIKKPDNLIFGIIRQKKLIVD